MVPYSCSLCSFRCLEAGDLANHTRRYKRHVEEARTRSAADVAGMLNKSSNPIVIGDMHMRPLTRESEEPVEEVEDDAIFDQDEDQELPSWLLSETRSSLTSFRRASSSDRAGATGYATSAGVPLSNYQAPQIMFSQQPSQATALHFPVVGRVHADTSRSGWTIGS